MKKKFFTFIFFITFSSFLIEKTYAYNSDPKVFISEIVEEAKKVLVDSNSKEFKNKKLSEIALKTVDIKGIGFYTLGKYRKTLSDEQLEKYSILFEIYFREYDKKIYCESRFKLTANGRFFIVLISATVM